jgi:hypothetical protein
MGLYDSIEFNFFSGTFQIDLDPSTLQLTVLDGQFVDPTPAGPFATPTWPASVPVPRATFSGTMIDSSNPSNTGNVENGFVTAEFVSFHGNPLYESRFAQRSVSGFSIAFSVAWTGGAYQGERWDCTGAISRLGTIQRFIAGTFKRVMPPETVGVGPEPFSCLLWWSGEDGDS